MFTCQVDLVVTGFIRVVYTNQVEENSFVHCNSNCNERVCMHVYLYIHVHVCMCVHTSLDPKSCDMFDTEIKTLHCIDDERVEVWLTCMPGAHIVCMYGRY